MNATEVGHALGLPRATVRDWLYGSIPRRDHLAAEQGCCDRCEGPEHRFAELPSEYVYLLGLYLGDGYISLHPRAVYRLRIVLDVKYPGIIDSAVAAMEVVRGGRARVLRRRANCVDVYPYWKSWPCLLARPWQQVQAFDRAEATAAGDMTIYVSRKADVAALDEFIGPKR